MNLLAYLLLLQGSDALKLNINDDDSLMEMVDSQSTPYSGNKCTYNIRRATGVRNAVSTWNKYKDSTSEFVPK